MSKGNEEEFTLLEKRAKGTHICPYLSNGGKKALIMNSNPNDEEDHDNYKSAADHEDEQLPWSTLFKPKKGSVIPKKRRLVKSMIVDQIVQLYSVSGKTQEAAAETSKTKENSSSNHV